MLDTLEGLKKYCEDPLFLAKEAKLVVPMRDDSALNKRLDEPLN